MNNRFFKATLISLISSVAIFSIRSAIAQDSNSPTPSKPSPDSSIESIPPGILTPKVETTPLQLEVISEGNEPKQQLRFKVPSDRQETATLIMNLESSTTLAGSPTPKIKLPTNVVEIQIKVTKVDPNGDMHVTFRYPNAQVVVTDDNASPEVVKLMRTLMPKIAKLKGEFVIDESGQTKDTKLSLPTENDPLAQQLSSQLTNSFNQLSSPIPQLAIGKGAKWRTTNSVKVNGITIKQIANYHLVDLQDKVATIEIKLEQIGDPQTVGLPGLPPELSVKLRSFKTQGEGRMKFSFDRLLPISATSSLNSIGHMGVKIPGSDRELSTQIDTSMNISVSSQK